MKASAGTLQMPARLECFCLQAAETEGWVVSCRADGMPARKGGNDKSETASDTSWKCRLTLSDVQRVREPKRLWQTGQQSLTLYIKLPVTWTASKLFAEQISSMTGVWLRGMIHCQSLFLIEWSDSKVNLCQSLFPYAGHQLRFVPVSERTFPAIAGPRRWTTRKRRINSSFLEKLKIQILCGPSKA